jgi:predicted  nucleic acid-binding Zn-ribbon protein
LLEFTSIIARLATLTILFKAGNEFEKNIDKAFAKLKKEITDKNDIILEKDEKIAKLEDIINEINSKWDVSDK